MAESGHEVERVGPAMRRAKPDLAIVLPMTAFGNAVQGAG